jgi:hypothetical protein
LSIPLKYQPQTTGLFVNVSVGYLRHGPFPKESAYGVHVAFSSAVMLLACVALFDALRSSGPKVLAAILLSPLAMFSVINLVQAVRFYFGFATGQDTSVYWLTTYFRPEVWASYISGQASAWYLQAPDFIDFLVEAAKWCSMLGIAVWLSIAQFLAWRH